MATVTAYHKFNCHVRLDIPPGTTLDEQRKIDDTLCRELPAIVMSVDHPLKSEVVNVRSGVSPSVEIVMPKSATAEDVDAFADEIQTAIVRLALDVRKSQHEQADSLPNTPIRK